MPLNLEESVYFLRHFREARYKTLVDAEDFMSLCFCMEELGLVLTGKKKTLEKYNSDFAELFRNNSYSATNFPTWFKMVREARNDAAHRGVFARKVARIALKLGLIFEEAIMNNSDIKNAAHIMNEGFIEAKNFYTLSKVREIILENSFSYVPYFYKDKYYFISDLEIARFWHDSETDKSDRFITSLDQLAERLNLIPADDICESDPVGLVLSKRTILPLLVYKNYGSEKLYVGIITPFDLL